MIPLKVDTTPNRFPLITVVLIALCVAVFFAREYLLSYGQGFVPAAFMYALFHPGRNTADAALTLGVSFFLHAGPLHLLGNMWYLWLFGGALEHTMGSLRFTALYLVCGVVSMIAQAVSTPLSTIPVVGASGAIAGVMGASLVMLPLSRVVLWLPPIFFPRIPAVFFLVFWFLLQYFGMRGTLDESGGVAWWAHIGGFGCGFLLALELKRRAWVTRMLTARPANRAEHPRSTS